MTEPSPSHRLQTIDDLLLYRLNRMAALAGGMVVRLCEGGHGITRREWGVIGQLHERGPLAPSSLAEQFQLDRARTSRLVTSLVDKGLVLREVPPGNRRQALLRLSPAGEAVYAQLMPQVQDINRRILSALSDTEMAQLDGFISRLRASADQLRQALDAQLPKAQRRLGQRRRDVPGPEE